jgi:SAM-dependent methyltransferase
MTIAIIRRLGRDNMILLRFAKFLPLSLQTPLRRLYRSLGTARPEPLMYRVYLFEEMLNLAGPNALRGKHILEIGPRDGLDSQRLASLEPEELVMIDLPEKRDVTKAWLGSITCRHRYIEKNFMYMSEDEIADLGHFDLIWCTGVLYHNAEQLRFLRKLYTLLNRGGYLVLESATLRGPKRIREGRYVQIHYPDTFRETGTVTHLPTASAVKTWLNMVGFTEIIDSKCFSTENRNVMGLRMACIAHKTDDVGAGVYYGKSGLNPDYRFGDSV